jgi:hypothetical protein
MRRYDPRSLPPAWPFWPFPAPLTPKLQEAAARLFVTRAQSWGDTFRAMADIADQIDEVMRKASGRRGRGSRTSNRGREDEW